MIDNNPIIEKDLREGFANVVSSITNFWTESKENLKKIHDEFGQMLREINFKDIEKQFDGSLSHQLNSTETTWSCSKHYFYSSEHLVSSYGNCI